jgi:hypothetical protein
VGQEELWARKSCGPGRVVGQEVVWARKSCGPGRVVGQKVVGQEEAGSVVGQEELWAKKSCGPGRDRLEWHCVVWHIFWLGGASYILVHDDKCCLKAIDLFLAHILALFLAHGPGDVLHFYLYIYIYYKNND